jgi:hypothetical protein
MKKLLLILFISLGLIGCSESVPEKVDVNNQSYDWKKWDCFAYGYAGDFILTIGYIPELKKDGYAVGKLFLKDAESPIDTVYQMKGVQHNWEWDKYRIVIDSDGTGRYWDFSNADVGEEVMSKEVYECTSSGYVSFSKSFDNFFSY